MIITFKVAELFKAKYFYSLYNIVIHTSFVEAKLLYHSKWLSIRQYVHIKRYYVWGKRVFSAPVYYKRLIFLMKVFHTNVKTFSAVQLLFMDLPGLFT